MEDPFDERAVLHVVASKAREWGFTEDIVEEQLGRLAAFRQGRPWKTRRIGSRSEGSAYEEEFVEPKEEATAGFELNEKKEREPEVVSEASSDEAGFLPASKEMVPHPHGTYVLSVIGRSERKTLHRVGECHRVPGVHYVKYQLVGNDPPDAKEFHRSCRACFPRGLHAEVEVSEESREDDEVSSSDTSTSVEESEE